eukprot:5896313-Pyramimonas_sp.AAC.1
MPWLVFHQFDWFAIATGSGGLIRLAPSKCSPSLPRPKLEPVGQQLHGSTWTGVSRKLDLPRP